MLFQRDLASGCRGLVCCPLPCLVCLRCLFESLESSAGGLDVVGGLPALCGHGRARWAPRGIERLPGLLDLGRVEGWGAADDGLLAGVEFGELLVIGFVEAGGEVAVGLEACVAQAARASGREAAGRGPSIGVWSGVSQRSR